MPGGLRIGQGLSRLPGGEGQLGPGEPADGDVHGVRWCARRQRERVTGGAEVAALDVHVDLEGPGPGVTGGPAFAAGDHDPV